MRGGKRKDKRVGWGGRLQRGVFLSGGRRANLQSFQRILQQHTGLERERKPTPNAKSCQESHHNHGRAGREEKDLKKRENKQHTPVIPTSQLDAECAQIPR